MPALKHLSISVPMLFLIRCQRLGTSVPPLVSYPRYQRFDTSVPCQRPGIPRIRVRCSVTAPHSAASIIPVSAFRYQRPTPAFRHPRSSVPMQRSGLPMSSVQPPGVSVTMPPTIQFSNGHSASASRHPVVTSLLPCQPFALHRHQLRRMLHSASLSLFIARGGRGRPQSKPPRR